MVARTGGLEGSAMAKEKAAADARTIQPVRPVVRKIGTADLKEALSLGFADFKAMPTHLIFLFIIYPIVMVIVARSFAGYEVLPAVFPLLAGPMWRDQGGHGVLSQA